MPAGFEVSFCAAYGTYNSASTGTTSGLADDLRSYNSGLMSGSQVARSIASYIADLAAADKAFATLPKWQPGAAAVGEFRSAIAAYRAALKHFATGMTAGSQAEFDKGTAGLSAITDPMTSGYGAMIVLARDYGLKCSTEGLPIGNPTLTPEANATPQPTARLAAPTSPYKVSYSPSSSTSRTSPVPLGQAHYVGNWLIKVAKVDTDAWPELKTENQFNDPPASGNSLVMVAITATYKGSDTGSLGFGILAATVGSGNVGFKSKSEVMPNGCFKVGDVFPDGAVTCNLAVFEVPKGEVTSLSMYLRSITDLFRDNVYYALR